MPQNQLTAKERYEYLIRARNFHYDNYNKWMTYFYLAIGSIFVGYCSLKNLNCKLNTEIYLLLFLGYIVSLFWFWANKGYYFWNINFITLVNECEEKDLNLEPSKRVYFIIANKSTQNNYFNPISGANISSSKISILFSFMISISWGYLIYANLLEHHFFLLAIYSIATTLAISLIIPRVFLKSKIEHFPDLHLSQSKYK